MYEHWRARTPDEREQAFQAYLERSAPYVAAVEAAGDEPWHGGDIEARRELFMRRYRATCSGEGSSRHDASDQAAVTYNVDNVSSRDSVEVRRGIAP